MMRFEELDATTRPFMLEAFDEEEAGAWPYRGELLTPTGRSAWPRLMRAAILAGTEVTLTTSLLVPAYWLSEQEYERGGIVRTRKVNVAQAAERLALSEFSTFYTAGLGRRLRSEGAIECEIYRAGEPKWTPAECQEHEGRVVTVETILRGHRARYHGPSPDPLVFSVPFGPGCHHSIRRLRKH